MSRRDRAIAWLRALDVAAIGERVVLVAVLAIAALVSYTHLREVWNAGGAPWQDYGPLLVDGLFAAAWLRMRRRRRDGVPVGWLAWFALGVAALGTLAGNLAAAWVAGHKDPLAYVVAAVPALASILVWELVTGHSAHPRSDADKGRSDRPATPDATPPATAAVPAATPAEQPEPAEVATVAEHVARRHLEAVPATTTRQATATPPPAEEDEDDVAKARELLAAKAGRPTVMRELGLKNHEARALIEQPDRVAELLPRYRAKARA